MEFNYFLKTINLYGRLNYQLENKVSIIGRCSIEVNQFDIQVHVYCINKFKTYMYMFKNYRRRHFSNFRKIAN